MRARYKLTEPDDVSFYNQSTSEVVQRALKENSEDSIGERENDILTKSIQIKD
jgi:hypothetical protein